MGSLLELALAYEKPTLVMSRKYQSVNRRGKFCFFSAGYSSANAKPMSLKNRLIFFCTMKSEVRHLSFAKLSEGSDSIFHRLLQTQTTYE
jgi:hypothetical protein